MDNQVLLTTVVVICSLAGCYIVLYKYLEVRAMLKILDQQGQTQQQEKKGGAADLNVNEEFSQPAFYKPGKLLEDTEFAYDEHIPGMGPPPLAKMGFHLPPEVLAKLKQNQANMMDQNSNTFQAPKPEHKQDTPETNVRKRLICNWASVLHLSGLGLVTGIPFLNIILPTVVWLLKKEQHAYLAKQGREVINFQITLSLIQFLCLGLGALFVWIWPNAATVLFAWTKTVRVIFSTGMYIPFNLFTALPFFWGCVLTIRGAVAAYHGLASKYPYAQEFLFEDIGLHNTQHSEQAIKRSVPQVNPNPNNKKSGKISFG